MHRTGSRGQPGAGMQFTRLHPSTNDSNSSCPLFHTPMTLCCAVQLYVILLVCEYLLNTYYTPGTELDSGVTMMSKIGAFP